jgi:RNA polymerase sigma factor (sigma-70 family)
MSHMPIRTIVADDHQITREGLMALIEREPDMEVIGDAESGRDAVSLARKLRPDVIVMDISMPGLNGIDATRQIARDAPESRVLALSMHSERRYAAAMFAAGASGYLLKKCAFDELARAIRRVAEGGTYLSDQIASVVVQDYVRRLSEADDSAFSVLTEREREVLQLVSEGRTTKEIAKLLHVSPKTVETHRQNVMEKLDLHTVAELTKYAVREGITPSEP